MTNIIANCPMGCGQVSLRPADVSLTINVIHEHESSYSFVCPACKVLVTKPADAKVGALLMSAGIKPTMVGAAAPKPAPLTEADLRTFIAAMEATDYLADAS